METNEILARIEPVFHEITKTSQAVHAGLTREAAENWGSLQHVMFMVRLEEIFNIRFDGATVTKLNSIGDIVEEVQSKLPKT